MQQLLPAWEAARVGGARPDEPTAREMLAAARPWPALAAALGSLDHAWPDEASVRASVGDVNAALADARLPYVVDVWIVARSPVLLTHALVTRVPWRVGARSVEVMRLRRLDHLNVELGLYGATNEGLPAVMLDRIEASLAKDIPQMFAQPSALAAEFNEVDRAVLARDRGWLEARLGPAVAVAAHALAERDRLFEEMRARLNGGTLALDAPDGFVLGAEWLGTVEPLAEPLRAGGPLVLEDDLQRLERADGELREGPTSRALAETVELLALSTEAHEARHAGDEVDPVGPPPPQLFAVMPTNSSAMIGMADKEARALLGEIHDGPFPACLTLARLVRGAFGRYARPTPHLFATLAILDQLAPGAERAPLERLTAACGLPDLELRRRTADAWQKLYGAPMPPARRLGPAQ
jgi:hypothetical protein